MKYEKKKKTCMKINVKNFFIPAEKKREIDGEKWYEWNKKRKCKL